MLTDTINPMSEWSEELVLRFAKTARKYRESQKLKVQDVADRTAKIGHPLSRTAITDFELGRRKDRLMVGDALAISYALGVPLGTLLYPNQPDGLVEVVPGNELDSFSAAGWLTGDNIPHPIDHLETAEGTFDFGLPGGEWANNALDGVGLHSASDQLRSAQSTLEGYEHDYERAVKEMDLKKAEQFRKVIESQRLLVERIKEKVIDLGGVVNDG